MRRSFTWPHALARAMARISTGIARAANRSLAATPGAGAAVRRRSRSCFARRWCRRQISCWTVLEPAARESSSVVSGRCWTGERVSRRTRASARVGHAKPFRWRAARYAMPAAARSRTARCAASGRPGRRSVRITATNRITRAPVTQSRDQSRSHASASHAKARRRRTVKSSRRFRDRFSGSRGCIRPVYGFDRGGSMKPLQHQAS